ncbi:MAG: MarR family transcriptional regulator [Devosiaceae bacterium]|nr:MarR family transcriptional regulator [Devosiaceae bacterium MH13]
MLMQFARINRIEGERILKTFGIRGGQEVVMGSLWEADGQRPGDIAKRVGVTAASITKHVKNLTDEGFVTAAPDEEDRRVSRVFLTGKGRDVRQAVAREISKMEQTLTEPLKPMDRERFVAMLAVLVDENRKRLGER